MIPGNPGGSLKRQATSRAAMLTNLNKAVDMGLTEHEEDMYPQTPVGQAGAGQPREAPRQRVHRPVVEAGSGEALQGGHPEWPL